MNAYEWTMNEYPNLAKKLNDSKKIESHPCKYRIISRKIVTPDAETEEK